MLQGVGIGRGLAVGPVLRMPDKLPDPDATPSTLGPDSEKERVTHALAGTAEELSSRASRVEGMAREVLEAQVLMVDDPMLRSEIDVRVDTGATAERAVFEAFGKFKEMLTGIGGYLGERAADLDDVSQRVLARLAGVSAPGVPTSDVPFVLVARDLAPADTALLDLTKVLAVVTAEGGPTSHTAILAREKGLTAVVGVPDALRLPEGESVVVDASAGSITTGLEEQALDAARERAQTLKLRAEAPITPGALRDGTAVPLLANLGATSGIEAALAAGAEGVGLFRTEFLFLDAPAAPTVASQYGQYVTLLRAFPGKKVVVRVLDAGADKPLSFLTNTDEENPALGLRGIRALRAHPEVLRDQLTALARAAGETEAELQVMAPMVATVEETTWFVALCHELGLKTAGVMVEVPAAALLADRILAEAGFASIGTNDLTQYTLAADRLLGSVANLQDPWHPAVLRLVQEVGRAGRVHGRPVGICGEAAADPLLAVVLVGLGATTLSMSPAAIADVRAELSLHDAGEARSLAEAALAADDGRGARAAVRARLQTPPPSQ